MQLQIKKARQCAHNFSIKNTYSASCKYFNPPRQERTNAHRPRAPRKQSLRGWNLGGVVYHPKPRRRAKDESRVTSLSLRRSTINVENVVVRLRQSSAICLRANARSAFLFTGSPRSFHSLAMTKGSKCSSPHHSCHSRAGGNKAWVVISYLIGEIIQRCVLFMYL